MQGGINTLYLHIHYLVISCAFDGMISSQGKRLLIQRGNGRKNIFTYIFNKFICIHNDAHILIRDDRNMGVFQNSNLSMLAFHIFLNFYSFHCQINILFSLFFIIGHLLGRNLTVIPQFHSHYETMRFLDKKNPYPEVHIHSNSKLMHL